MAVHEMAKALGDAHAVYEACPPLERHAEVVQPLHGAADSTNSLARMAYRASQGRRGGRKDRRCRRKSVCGSSTHLAQAASEGSANSTELSIQALAKSLRIGLIAQLVRAYG